MKEESHDNREDRHWYKNEYILIWNIKSWLTGKYIYLVSIAGFFACIGQVRIWFIRWNVCINQRCHWQHREIDYANHYAIKKILSDNHRRAISQEQLNHSNLFSGQWGEYDRQIKSCTTVVARPAYHNRSPLNCSVWWLIMMRGNWHKLESCFAQNFYKIAITKCCTCHVQTSVANV